MILCDKRAMSDISVVGGKGYGLAKLCEKGYPVPDFFVVTADSDFT